jgi:opacity protein-like surface antigen
MNHRKPLKLFITALTLGCSSLAMATHPFYLAANVGAFQGSYDQKLLDQLDIIPGDIGLTSEQHGYTGGLAIGYSKVVNQQYIVGAELSGNLDSNHAYYAEGSSAISINDTTEIKNHIDLTFVPGVLLTDTVTAYLKLGVSVASAQDSVNSPTYLTPGIPTMVNYTTNKNITGFAGGVGIKKFLNDRFAVFIEGNYHDYGVINFNNVSNYSTTYSHSAHMYSYDGVVGLAIGL